MRGPAYEPLNVSNDAEEYLDHPQIRSVQSRPAIYYGEGPFSPPSSDDEDDYAKEVDNDANSIIRFEIGNGDDEEELLVGGHRRPRSWALKYLLIALVCLVVLAGLIGILAAHTYSGSLYHGKGRRHIELDHIFNGTFFAHSKSLEWVSEAGDGVFSSTNDQGDISLVDLRTNTSKILVKRVDVKDEHGTPLSWNEWKLSPDMKYILMKADRLKQWRHSSFGNYYIHDLSSQETYPITSPSYPPVTAYATWSPAGETIAYVHKSDLYVLTSPDAKPIRVTTGGNSSVFHGVPDWVYEEEVYTSDYTLWWSPDSAKLAFLRFDETDVDEFSYPVYNPSSDPNKVVPYPEYVSMKYPKPGYRNPLVSVHIFDLEGYLAAQESEEELHTLEKVEREDIAPVPASHVVTLSWEGQRLAKDSIIQEVAWVHNATLIIKETDRSGNDGSVILFDLSHRLDRMGVIVRSLGKDGELRDSGWIDMSQYIYRLPESMVGSNAAYLDILPNDEGYNHIALFSPADSSIPKWLTTGPWEVTSGVLGVDVDKAIVYFLAAAPSSIERNLYSAAIPRLSEPAVTPGEPTALTDSSQMSYYSASFSPQNGFYVLSYLGPNIPYQQVIEVDNKDFQYTLTDNKELNETSSQFQTPTIIRQTITSDGYELNAMEIRPPAMDDSGRTKYPVLFRVYGGPGSQMVSARWERDWHHYLTCSLKYIIVVVDGRGTGFKGRNLRNPVHKNLGENEVKDQLNAARLWASRRYVDARRIGIWGWSYGGYMSSKVVEANAGIHSLAMAVAPVSSWRLYDSIYTERFMDTPQNNPDGYVNGSITNVEGFKNVDFLLAHGSGDDNVHFANSAHLLDMFTAAQVRRFRFRMFTDSDHSINIRGAYRELHEWMTAFLKEQWGTGGYRRGW